MNKVKQLKGEALRKIHHEFVMSITKLAFLEQAMQVMCDDNANLDGDELRGLVEIIRDVKKEIQFQADAFDAGI